MVIYMGTCHIIITICLPIYKKLPCMYGVSTYICRKFAGILSMSWDS